MTETMLSPKTTLDGLRQRIDHQTPRPDPLTRQEFDLLDGAGQRSFDEARLRWLGSGALVPTPQFNGLIRTVRAHLRTSDPLTIGESGVVITGPAAVGKTTALWNLLSKIEQRVAKDDPLYRSHGVVPAVYIEVPPRASPKSMAAQIVDFFGYPYNRRTTTQEQIISMAVDLLQRHRTQVLIIDELQMLRLDGHVGDSAINVLKTLMNSTGCLMVFSGIDLLSGLASRAAEQIVARCEVMNMAPYPSGSEEARGHWSMLVAQFEREMYLLDVEPGHLGPFADRLLVKSGGRIGGLRRTLARAMSTAIDERDDKGSEYITAEILFGFDGFNVAAKPVKSEQPKRPSRSARAS